MRWSFRERPSSASGIHEKRSITFDLQQTARGEIRMKQSAKVICLDPTCYIDESARQQSARIPSLKGIALGLLSNGQDMSDLFLEQVGAALQRDYGVERLIFRRKTNLSQPYPDSAMAELLNETDALIAGVGV
jgi:hypothetical protein